MHYKVTDTSASLFIYCKIFMCFLLRKGISSLEQQSFKTEWDIIIIGRHAVKSIFVIILFGLYFSGRGVGYMWHFRKFVIHVRHSCGSAWAEL
jgi:hypothetical protein